MVELMIPMRVKLKPGVGGGGGGGSGTWMCDIEMMFHVK